MTGTVFRPLFYGIVQQKALLSFGSSSLFFPPQGSIAISSCSCMKMAWASYDSFGATTFLLKNQNKKGRKTENVMQEWIHTCHLSHADLHITCCCHYHTADMDSQLISFTCLIFCFCLLVQCGSQHISLFISWTPLISSELATFSHIVYRFICSSLNSFIKLTKIEASNSSTCLHFLVCR